MQQVAQLLSLIESSTRSARALHRTISRSMENTISLSDIESFIVSYWFGVGFLMQSRPLSPPVVGALKQLLNNLFECSGYLEFIESCSEYRAHLCATGSTTTPFKGQTRWARSLVRLVKLVYQQPVQHPSRNFDQLMTYLGWLKRVPIFIRPAEEAVGEYLANEERLLKLEFNPQYVDLLRSVWLEFFGDFQLTRPFRPRHGSGSTADSGRIASRKWQNLHWDSRTRIAMKAPDLLGLVCEGTETYDRIAKVVFVPKQAGKDRTICMEPAWLQFLQQGVFDQLRDYLHHGPARNHFDIHNQDINRDLCARAYVEGFSTIDLSNASDSVSWNLIRAIAKGTKLFGYLYATRSDRAILAGKEISLSKFAPMGSALCFPIECMIFSCICEVAYRIHYGEPSRGHLSGVAVYGDDIICPQEIYHLVLDILVSFGFVVNESKSYDFGPYYESCGVEYLCGARISTIRHPRAHLAFYERVSPDKIGMVTDLANSLYEGGYLLCRRLLLKYYEKAKVRCGKSTFIFSDCIDWSEDGLRPLYTEFGSGKWDRNLFRSYHPLRTFTSAPSRSSKDFRHFVCRMSYDTSYDGTLEIHEKWTDKAVRSLLAMGHIDLLTRGEIEDVGPCRAGRLHHMHSLTRRYM